MKRRLFYTLFILMLLGVGILAELSKPAPRLTFDENGNYTGFHDIPENYTVERARQDGCIIHDMTQPSDNGLMQNPIWREFVETAAKKRPASVRIMFIFDHPDSPSYQDVFYQDGSYCTFSSSAHDMQRRNFPYLLERSGRLPNASRDGSIAVLCIEQDKSYTEIHMDYLLSAQAFLRQNDYALILL